MLPVLLDLKIIKIYTFGVFLVLAFFWGMFWLWRNIKLTSYKEEDIFDGLFASLLGAFIGARAFFIIFNFSEFGFSPLKYILINGYPGLSLTGGFIGGFLIMTLYTRYKRIPFMHIVDYVIAPLLLALAIGKVGAFFAGNEIGTQTNFFLRVHYVGAEGLRHVVALYEAILLFLGFYISHMITFYVRRETIQRGFSFFFFVAYFSLVQLLLDFMKQNHIYLAGLSFNLMVGTVLFIVTTIYLATQYRQGLLELSKNLLTPLTSYGKQRINKTGIDSSEENSSGGGNKDSGDDEEASSK